MWSPPRILLAVMVAGLTAAPARAHDPARDRIHELSLAIASDPADIDLVIRRADLYRDIGEHTRALQDFDRAARLEPSRDIIHLGRALTLSELGRFDAALAAADAFLLRHPDHAPAWRVRAHCLTALHRVDDAIDALDHVIAFADPPAPDDYIARARLIASLGEARIDDAVAGLDEGLSRLGPAVSLQLAAVELEEKRGAFDAARLRRDEMHNRPLAPHGEARNVLETSTRSAGPSAAPLVTRGPYLQIGTAAGAVIRWRTNLASDSRVQYGTTPGVLDQTLDDPASTTEHVITLSGLSPDTRYYYSIGTTAEVLLGDDANHYFETAPTAGSDVPTRVWVVGDAGTKGARQAGVRNAYRNHPGAADTDVWLMLGDNAYEEGTDAEYQDAVFEMYPTFLRNTVLWSTRGNHDLIHVGGDNDYYDIFSMPAAAEAGGPASGTEAYYAFDYANVHFVCLDSQGSNRTPGGAMLTWLAQDLAATTQEWIIAFWHHPPYSKGSHDSDTELRLVEMRENALPILEAAGVDLVLAGHSHSYERSCLLDGHYDVSSTLDDSMKVDAGDGRPDGDGVYQKPASGPHAHNGAVYTVAGTSGSVGGGTYDHPVMITSLAKLGSLVLDIDGDELVATFIDTTGAALDSFVVSKADLPSTVRNVPVPRIPLSIQPNPFSTEARIRYDLASNQHVSISIFNVRGQHVRTLVDSPESAGAHASTWNGRDDRGHAVAQGVYFAVLRAGVDKRTARLVLVR